jgi:hypothetical protein
VGNIRKPQPVIFGGARFEAAVQQTFDVQAIWRRDLLVRGTKLGVLREYQEREERKKTKKKKKADFHKRSLNRACRAKNGASIKRFKIIVQSAKSSPYGDAAPGPALSSLVIGL